MSIATKICLIIVILAGGFGIYLGAVQIPPQISKLKEEKAASDGKIILAENAKKAVEKDRDSFKNESETKGVEVEDLKKQVKAEQDKIGPLQKVAEVAVAEAEKAKLDAARATEQAKTSSLSGSDQLKKVQADLKAASDKLATAESEKKKISDELKMALAKIPGEGGSLPDGLTGKITAVDPKWDFVLLNIGAKAGVQNGAEMIVSRAGKLIGRVKITKVEPNHSIGNMMKTWKVNDPKGKPIDATEGDTVFAAVSASK